MDRCPVRLHDGPPLLWCTVYVVLECNQVQLVVLARPDRPSLIGGQ